ncbi:MAG TPA: aminotransferase class V-fold PLP-dependent enzyme [Candidatus Coproplasma avicola]|uniref:Aminotransferase class V-fold PLP-dependent enzyme n=1 Tax=Candidatus Coproplasma avicola TaxID=2840744 RepID=A0A9D1J8P1_9FIRM|nr:aminotransferase class V-fold PLP-dependent enzyme [Candidatus Coproplasma avicola]
MIYFDNAATGGYKPESVITATMAALRACANPGRSGHALSVACAERVYSVRKILQSFFGAPSADRVIFTKNCTEALNIAILGSLKEGDRVVTTVAEHNSVLRPLKFLEEHRGVKVRYAPLDRSGNINIKALISLVDDSTSAVVMTLASNVTGAAPDVYAVRRAIPAHTYLICDGAQACGHESIDVTALGIDALAVAGHKGMLAAQGSGALIMSSRFNPEPIMFGGTGSESFNLAMPEFYPDRSEAGTLNYPAIISLGEGALYLKTRMYEHRDFLVYLTDKLLAGLTQMPFVRVYSRTNPYGIASFDVEGASSEDIADRLSHDYSVCVRAGLHCAPLMHGALGTSGLVRASLSPFNTEGEVEYFLKAMREIVDGR